MAGLNRSGEASFTCAQYKYAREPVTATAVEVPPSSAPQTRPIRFRSRYITLSLSSSSSSLPVRLSITLFSLAAVVPSALRHLPPPVCHCEGPERHRRALCRKPRSSSRHLALLAPSPHLAQHFLGQAFNRHLNPLTTISIAYQGGKKSPGL